MKLSKVKKVCMDAFEIIVKKAEVGLDVRTWIGTSDAMYPVRGLEMSAELAIRIWEIEQKKLKDIRIEQDEENEEALTLIMREDLEGFSFLGDYFADENADKVPGLARIATIENYVLLMDRDTGEGWIIRENRLEPVEGTQLIYIRLEKSRNLIGIYGGGTLEAVVYGMRWKRSEYLKSVIEKIVETYRAEEEPEAYRGEKQLAEVR